jgi:colicin import membrane protein
MSAASTFEDFRPRRPGGMGRGALLALLVHAGLLVALAFGVSWRSSESTGATAELWAAVPETAAPAAVAPAEPKPAPPPPKAEPEPVKPQARDADIAIEKAKAEKAKRELAEREAQKKRDEQQARLEREKAQKAERAEAERLAKLREEQLKRIAGQAGGTGAPTATGTGARDAGPSAGYAGRIVARVKPNIVFADSVPSTLRAEVEVRAAPDGTILGRRLVKASGNKDWDDAVLRAIDRTEILPRDVDGRVPSPITIGFTP